MIGAERVETALENRFSGAGWAFFKQFRPMTSFAATYSCIDAVAVGLWMKNYKILAFEIKVERSDFLKDVEIFNKKHRYALEISHEFYYVCPWNLIDRSEIPEVAGLMYVDKSFTIKKKKPAILREMESIQFHFFQAFAKEFGNTIYHTKIPIKFLGKKMTQEDFNSLLEEKKGADWKQEVTDRAKEILKERKQRKADLDEFLQELKSLCGFYAGRTDEEVCAEIKRYCDLGKKFSTNYDFLYHLRQLKEHTDKILVILDREKKD